MSAYFVILLMPRMLNSPGCCYAKTPKCTNLSHLQNKLQSN